MLSEIDHLDSHTPWRRVKRRICDDVRYTAVSDPSLREKWFDEFIERKVENEKLMSHERAKIEREKVSLRERDKVVQSDKIRIEQAMSKGRQSFQKEKASTDFHALLNELIQDINISWREAKNILKADHRFRSIEILSRDEYLSIFDQHLNFLHNKLTESYRRCLDDHGLVLTSEWDKIYEKVHQDPRCVKFSKSMRACKNEFLNYLEDKNKLARNELRVLLSETKIIDHRFNAKAKLIPSLYDELFEILERDNRYNILDHVPNERREIIDAYLCKKEKIGAPLPPTSTVPKFKE
ncbi:hypothetical protein MXB_94 [Myxobolus squamalis]|nr:hypothetical protein MXB_94 [Myxobolus squamalis]